MVGRWVKEALEACQTLTNVPEIGVWEATVKGSQTDIHIQCSSLDILWRYQRQVGPDPGQCLFSCRHVLTDAQLLHKRIRSTIRKLIFTYPLDRSPCEIHVTTIPGPPHSPICKVVDELPRPEDASLPSGPSPEKDHRTLSEETDGLRLVVVAAAHYIPLVTLGSCPRSRIIF